MQVWRSVSVVSLFSLCPCAVTYVGCVLVCAFQVTTSDRGIENLRRRKKKHQYPIVTPLGNSRNSGQRKRIAGVCQSSRIGGKLEIHSCFRDPKGVKSIRSNVKIPRLPGSESWHHYLLLGSPWVNYFNSLSLSFSIFKIRLIILGV